MVMKKLLAVLSLIILPALAVPCWQVSGRPLRIPHENPDTASVTPEAADLLLSLSRIFSITADRRYKDAQEILAELKQAALPPELQKIVDVYHTLSAQILDNLNEIESLIDNAKVSFSAHNTTDATDKLSQAKSSLDRTNVMLVELGAAVNSLGEYLGIFSGMADGLTRQAFDQLNGNLERIAMLTDKLAGLSDELVADPGSNVVTSFFFPTTIEFSVPAVVYPGLPAVINGKITSAGSTASHSIRIFLDGTLMTEASVSTEFSVGVTPPEQILDGKHVFTVTALPQGLYAEASARQTINIVRMPLSADIQVPRFALLPSTFTVSGRVYDGSNPLANTSVNITVGKMMIPVATSPDGAFTTSVNLSLGFSLTGMQNLTLDIKPSASWYAPVIINKQFFALNPLLIIGLIVVVVIVLILLTKSRKHVPALEKHTDNAIFKPGIPEKTQVISTPRPRHKVTEEKGRIIAAYTEALKPVEIYSDIVQTPAFTLREFLECIRLSPPVAAGHFADLTAITEAALYSPDEIPKEMVVGAEKLAAGLKKELSDGTP
jgi:hypothetical protein